MSKICLCVLHMAKARHCEIVSQINSIIHKNSVFLLGDIAYHEPIFDVIDRNASIVCSISDNSLHDNCEFLLLPDDCSINGFKNPTPFFERMKIIQDVLKEMSRYCNRIELFVGDSGCGYDEYEEIQISVRNFAEIAKCLNSPNSPDMHFVFTPM